MEKVNKLKRPCNGTVRIYGLPDGAQILCPAFDGSTFIVLKKTTDKVEFITEKGAPVTVSQYQPLLKVGDHYQFA